MNNYSPLTIFFIAGLWVLVLLSLPVRAQEQRLTLLANGDVSAWQYQTFNGILPTQYRTAHDDKLGSKVLFAHSEKGASGYVLPTLINLKKTPWLHFQWQIDTAGNNFNERNKAGDDFAFRLYFIVRNGFKYTSLSLVRSQEKAHAVWQSPHSGWLYDLRFYAVAGGDKPLGTWQTSSVNLAILWHSIFGTPPPTLQGVGFMTDGDSAAVEMRTRYGNIVLSDSSVSPFALTR